MRHEAEPNVAFNHFSTHSCLRVFSVHMSIDGRMSRRAPESRENDLKAATREVPPPLHVVMWCKCPHEELLNLELDKSLNGQSKV